MRGRAISDDDRAGILFWFDAGSSYRLIAARFDRPLGTVRSLLSDAIQTGRCARRRQRENSRTASREDYRSR